MRSHSLTWYFLSVAQYTLISQGTEISTDLRGASELLNASFLCVFPKSELSYCKFSFSCFTLREGVLINGNYAKKKQTIEAKQGDSESI